MAHVITFEDDITNGDTGNGAGLFDDDDPFSLPPPLPPLSPEPHEQANQDGAGAKGESKDEREKKKVKRSPQPKLDAVRLCCDRGLPALIHLCDDIKFKGKGHEASDLKLLLQHYEHWAHRLFPKFPFMDVVDQVETLGNKKLVQNCVKRIRRGEQETVADDDNSDTEIAQNIESQDSTPLPQTAASPTVNTIQSFGGQIETQDRMIILTPEQQERIRLNRETALSRRKAALEKTSKDNSAQNDNPAEDFQVVKDVEDKQHRIKDHCLVQGDTEMEHDYENHGSRAGEALVCDKEPTVGNLVTSTVCNNEEYEGKHVTMSPAAEVVQCAMRKVELGRALEGDNHAQKPVVESDAPVAGDVLKSEVELGHPSPFSDVSLFQQRCSTESNRTAEQIPDEKRLGVEENDMDQLMEMEVEC